MYRCLYRSRVNMRISLMMGSKPYRRPGRSKGVKSGEQRKRVEWTHPINIMKPNDNGFTTSSLSPSPMALDDHMNDSKKNIKRVSKG